jgi:hypothetical protein
MKSEEPVLGQMMTVEFWPTLEISVREWFAANANILGWCILKSQERFPDYILRVVSEENLPPFVPYRIGGTYRCEAEFASGNFIKDKHPFSGCDFVLCWNHNCRLPLPVWELSIGTWHPPNSEPTQAGAVGNKLFEILKEEAALCNLGVEERRQMGNKKGIGVRLIETKKRQKGKRKKGVVGWLGVYYAARNVLQIQTGFFKADKKDAENNGFKGKEDKRKSFKQITGGEFFYKDFSFKKSLIAYPQQVEGSGRDILKKYLEFATKYMEGA